MIHTPGKLSAPFKRPSYHGITRKRALKAHFEAQAKGNAIDAQRFLAMVGHESASIPRMSQPKRRRLARSLGKF